MIAHRLSTVRYADDIFVLENGNIIDHGNYNDLIQTNTTFKEMDALS